MKNAKVVLTLGLLIGATTLQAAVFSIPLRTGFDEGANTVLANGASDSTFFISNILTAPADGVPRNSTVPTTSPLPAFWPAALPGTKYVSRGTSVSGNTGTYFYDWNFSLGFLTPAEFAATFFEISGSVFGDNAVQVLLNGTEIMPTTEFVNFANVKQSNHVLFGTTDQSLFINGANTLRFAVVNFNAGPTGLNVSATLTGVPEPAEWAMIFAALIGVGFFFRREGLTWLQNLKTQYN